ncbi:hypothetical protein H310_14039 [Aphanomyces invadans]|uniref:Uncharacterized protein n=1 Tax=Aphanomyces invadans TaxID=157072 RepID=A0A024TBI0_9STRA|nr:hypothetical protein H310_14039 [Aphanomyces invadans]ETV91359.1 hypothetical protein H310_14039 [Aphanomyces invadans]|eukprot:XP_008879987.1 hypothetical protein H310_14039 [Aphanomyces invadans]
MQSNPLRRPPTCQASARRCRHLLWLGGSIAAMRRCPCRSGMACLDAGGSAAAGRRGNDGRVKSRRLRHEPAVGVASVWPSTSCRDNSLLHQVQSTTRSCVRWKSSSLRAAAFAWTRRELHPRWKSRRRHRCRYRARWARPWMVAMGASPQPS